MNNLSLFQVHNEGLTPSSNDCAEHLLHEGQMHLLKTDDFASSMQLFAQSLALSPQNWKLIYEQGLSLLEFATRKMHKQALLFAHKRFKTASILAPEHGELWETWGYCLSILGALTQEERFLREALEKVERAISLGSTSQELYWERGKIYFRLSEHSGEALDAQLAIDAYQCLAQKETALPSDFWLDFGIAYLHLSSHINDMCYSLKAISCFRHAAFLDRDNTSAWKYLGQTFANLYFVSHDEDHFTQATACFSVAAKHCPNDVLLWSQWAEFCCQAARHRPDTNKLRSCIEKCHRILSLKPNCAKTIALLAESLGMLGKAMERIDLIIEGENRILQIAEEEEDDPEIWRAHGHICMILGEYFHDLDIFYQAIEKFQVGLSLDRTQHALWHAMASTYSLIGEREDCPEEYERALRFYQKAIALYPATHYIIDYAIALSKYGEITQDQSSLEKACVQFENILSKQKQAIYQHPDWLFYYACALDALGEFYEDESIYMRSIEYLAHVLMIDPDFTIAHHRSAVALSHLGELSGELLHFEHALHHIRLAAKQDEDNEQILCDWAIILMHIAQRTIHPSEAEQLWHDAERKLLHAVQLGSASGYYHLGCLHALLGYVDSALMMLEKAEKLEGLPPLNEMVEDEWLDNMRNSPSFQDLMERLGQRQHNQ